MGITARGAWESVRWHFASLRLNPDADDFTVVGVGDMSGDVFGNGMLLSRHIKLVAAFDHRHVFIDPSPEPAVSFAERQRLFDLPRSSWADYDPSLISAGGGVWPRTAKSVPISAQARAALGLDDSVAALSPDELISTILRAPVDLLWSGGIGTYVKASSQTDADAGDRSNDAVRISAPSCGRGSSPRAATSGYPGRADRVRARRRPGEHRLHRQLGRRGHLRPRGQHQDPAGRRDRQRRDPADERGGLLHALTDEVAAHVLRHNDGQNMALTVGRYQAPRLLHVHARYLRQLARQNRVSLERDGLPGDKEIAARRSAGTGLDDARARPAARAHQDRRRAAGARLRPARRPRPAVRAGRATSRRRCGSGSLISSASTGCAGRSSPPR